MLEWITPLIHNKTDFYEQSVYFKLLLINNLSTITNLQQRKFTVSPQKKQLSIPKKIVIRYIILNKYMKIAICSDSHDNIVNIEKFLKYCADNNVEIIIHCGDVTTKDTQNYFQENFNGEILFAEGNAEIEVQEKLKKTNRFQRIKREPVPFIEKKVEELRIAACHKRDKGLRLALSGKYHLVFYGHNHKPWQEKVEKTFLINPGNLAGMFYKATFAVYNTETKQLELKLLELL